MTEPSIETMPVFLRQLVDNRPARDHKGISGTDIKRIMAGEWPDLYLEKTGQVQPEPLTNLPPLLGKYIEPFHRAWYEWQTHNTVIEAGTVSVYADPGQRLPFAAYATLDGRIQLVDNSYLPWEAKTVGGFIQRDALIAREFPQLQWQMLCEGTEALELSIMYLNQRWENLRIERDDEAIQQLTDMASQFWQHVVDGVMPQAQVVEQVTPVRELVDMRGSKEWHELERMWLNNRQPAKLFTKADKLLKKEIPADAKSGFGEQLSFTRNKAGAVTLLPMTQKQKAELLK